jgi:hypothetical protein
MARRKSKTTTVGEPSAESEKLADEKLAMEFLAGVVEPNKKGLPSLVYLSDLPDGGKREKEARAALVRLLIGPEMSRELRYALALLFAPDGDWSTSVSWGDHMRARYRELRFHKVGRGQPTRLRYENSAIAMIIWDLIRGDDTRPPMSRKDAIEAVRKRYKMEFDTVDGIEKDWGRRMPQFRVRPRR